MANSSRVMAPEMVRFLSLLPGFTPAGVPLAFEKEYGQAVTRIKECIHFTRRITKEGSLAGIQPLHPHRSTVTRTTGTPRYRRTGDTTVRGIDSFGKPPPPVGYLREGRRGLRVDPGDTGSGPILHRRRCAVKAAYRVVWANKGDLGPKYGHRYDRVWGVASVSPRSTSKPGGLEAAREQVGTAPIGVRDAQHRVHHLLLDRLEGP
jgi:hypothetical protein